MGGLKVVIPIAGRASLVFLAAAVQRGPVVGVHHVAFMDAAEEGHGPGVLDDGGEGLEGVIADTPLGGKQRPGGNPGAPS